MRRFSPCLILALVAHHVPLIAADDSRLEVTVPRSIPADESRDVTAELNAFFAELPNSSHVRFPEKARYRIDGTLLIEYKQQLIIEGNGVVFRAVERGEDHAKSENYAGWKQTRNRAHIRIRNSRQILIKSVEVHGAHPEAGRKGIYDGNGEAQHGFDILGGKDITLENVTVHDVYGDCVYLSKAKGVIVRNSKLTRCGRQGIAIATGEDILIEKNEIADSRRRIIDIEPYGTDWNTGNIRIIGNRLGGSRLLLLPMGGSGTIGTLFVADNINTEPNGTPAVSNTGKPEQNRGPLMMINNQFTIGGSPAAGLRIRHNDGVFVAGNQLSFPANRKMTALDAEGSRGIAVANRLTDAHDIMGQSSDITQLANLTSSQGELSLTEWQRIPGGFAVRVTLEEGYVIGLMRGGPDTGTSPEMISGYGQSTAAQFAWYHLQNGKVIAKGTRH